MILGLIVSSLLAQGYFPPGGSGGVSTSNPNAWSAAQNFTNNTPLCFGTSSDSCFTWNTLETPDTLTLGLGSTKTFLIADQADMGFDFAPTVDGTKPTMILASADQSTTKWLSFGMHSDASDGAYLRTGEGGIHLYSFNGAVWALFGTKMQPNFSWGSAQQHGLYYSASDGVMGLVSAGGNDRITASITSTVLTESTLTPTFRLLVATDSACSGKLSYSVLATDGTDMQTRFGEIKFAVVNKAGTESCTITNMLGVSNEVTDESIMEGPGTLEYDLDCVTTPTNGADIRINAVSSLSQTLLRAQWVSISNSGSGFTGSCGVQAF